MKAVKFLMSHTVGTLYGKGETASFEDVVADDLVERKIATEVKMKRGKKAETQAPELTDEQKKEAAKKALQSMTVQALDKIIDDEAIADVAEGANKATKVEAIIAARAE